MLVKRFIDIFSEATSSFANLEITGITSDSSKVKPCYVFVALKGEKIDGARFIPQAIENGAAVVVSSLRGAESDVAIRRTEEKQGRIASSTTRNDEHCIFVENPRLALAKMAAAFYGRQPENMVAVTGTDGKTSTADFFRQLMFLCGEKSMSVGTIGVISGEGKNLYEGTLTTPDSVELHGMLAEATESGITHAAMEASSHGLSQYRLDGVRLKAAAFVNIARDHLDYHKTEEAYFAAKARLFSEVLPEGETAVLNRDDKRFHELKVMCEKRGQKIIGFGRRECEFIVENITPHPHGQDVSLNLFGKKYEIKIPLFGEFQVMNILAAIGLAVGCGVDLERLVAVIPKLKGVPGRLEQAAVTKSGTPVFVDYAHTPAALANILAVLRKHTHGKLHVVFGCGGDRDAGKRPQMGKIAVDMADEVIITDDNPRSEQPETIRAAILAGCAENAGKCKEIADRAKAIEFAVSRLKEGDVLVIAGKGHEKVQIIGAEKIPFDDVLEAKKAVEK